MKTTNEYRVKTQKELRRMFWEDHSSFAHQAREAGIISKGQNAQCATVRCAFVDWLDALQKDGIVSEVLANRVTL